MKTDVEIGSFIVLLAVAYAFYGLFKLVKNPSERMYWFVYSSGWIVAAFAGLAMAIEHLQIPLSVFIGLTSCAILFIGRRTFKTNKQQA